VHRAKHRRPAGHARELRRVVRPGGRLGLLVYLAEVAELDDPPQGNHFPSSGQLHDLFGQAGLEVVDVADFRDITQPPPDWSSRVEAVERELHRGYGHTPELTEADEQSDRIGRLLRSGQLTSQVILFRVDRKNADGRSHPHRSV
jgi:hypothetical protein